MANSTHAGEGANFELRARILRVVTCCIDEVPVEKLTISMICERAQISRPTFYRQFTDRYDVFNWFLRTTMRSSLSQVGVVFTWKEALERFCRVMEANQNLAAAYLADRSAFSPYSKLVFYIQTALLGNIALRPGYEQDVPVQIRFQVAAFSRSFVAAFVDWLERECRIDPSGENANSISMEPAEWIECTLTIIPQELFTLLNTAPDGTPFSNVTRRQADKTPLIEYVAEDLH